MNYLSNNDFIRIEGERQDRAIEHQSEMLRKFRTTDYTQWKDYWVSPDGEKFDTYHEPLPRSMNFVRVFYGAVFQGSATGIVPFLEARFEKDEVDLAYLEGLLADAEGKHNLVSDGTAVFMPGDGRILVWPNTTPASRAHFKKTYLGGYDEQSWFYGGAVPLERIKSVRAWINRARTNGLSITLSTTSNMESNHIVQGSTPKLNLRQIALVYIYNGQSIPKVADAIAKSHGHNSGAKLYEHYNKLNQRAGRVGDDIIGQKLAPMIKDIAVVVPYLSGTAQQQAREELQTLKSRK